MASYIYTVTKMISQVDPPELKFASTRKYEAQRYLRGQVNEGESLALYEVERSRDGIPETTKVVDVYEFLNVDPGEVE